MTDFLAAVAIFALFLAYMAMGMAADLWVDRISSRIITGEICRRAVPMMHRRRLLQVNLLTTTSGVVGLHAGAAIAWLMIGRRAPNEPLSWLTYFFAFMAVMGAFSWAVYTPLSYRHLSNMLEGDTQGA